MTPAASRFVRSGLILLFGALPASNALPLTIFGVIAGLGGLLGGEPLNAVYLLWALCGLYGTISLWILVFQEARAVTVIGLFAGTLAMLFWLGIVVWHRTPTFTYRELAELAFFNIAPIVIAVSVMAVFFYKKSGNALSVD